MVDNKLNLATATVNQIVVATAAFMRFSTINTMTVANDTIAPPPGSYYIVGENHIDSSFRGKLHHVEET